MKKATGDAGPDGQGHGTSHHRGTGPAGAASDTGPGASGRPRATAAQVRRRPSAGNVEALTRKLGGPPASAGAARRLVEEWAEISRWLGETILPPQVLPVLAAQPQRADLVIDLGDDGHAWIPWQLGWVAGRPLAQVLGVRAVVRSASPPAGGADEPPIGEPSRVALLCSDLEAAATDGTCRTWAGRALAHWRRSCGPIATFDRWPDEPGRDLGVLHLIAPLEERDGSAVLRLASKHGDSLTAVELAGLLARRAATGPADLRRLIVLDVPWPGDPEQAARQLVLRETFAGELARRAPDVHLLATGFAEADPEVDWLPALSGALGRGGSLAEIAGRLQRLATPEGPSFESSLVAHGTSLWSRRTGTWFRIPRLPAGQRQDVTGRVAAVRAPADLAEATAGLSLQPEKKRNLAESVVTDLAAQNRRLLDEFDNWRARAAASGDLVEHQSQIRRTTDTLRGLLGAIVAGTALDGTATAAASLDGITELRHRLGTVDLVWDFFRDKFAQRDTGLFADHLGAADDLAWGCYLPFLEAAVEAATAAAAGAPPELRPEEVKDPPLLFYNSERSPFAQARASAFRPLGLSARDVESFRRVLARLPVPVIGLPWFQARSVPALVFVAHEAGHVVAEDLRLAGAFDGLIDGLGLGDGHARVWKSWADEAFADVFGVLATGSAYARRLARLLAADLGTVRNQKIDPEDPGAYPSYALRIALCHRTQELLGLDVDPLWQKTYRTPTGDSFPFAADVGQVVEALLRGPYPTLGGRGLAEVMTWTPDDDASATTVASATLVGTEPAVPFAVRTWVAAAVDAQAGRPELYADQNLDARLAGAIVAARRAAVRSQAGAALRQRMFAARPQEPSAARAPSDLAELDRARGAELAALLTEPPPER